MNQPGSVALRELIPAFPPYPLAKSAKGFLFVSGVRATEDSEAGSFSDLPREARARAQGYTAADLLEAKVSSDAWHTHRHLDSVLEAFGSGRDRVLRQHIWQRDKAYFPSYEQIRMLMQPAPAPSSGVGVAELVANSRGWIGIDCIAASSGDCSLGPVAITVPPAGGGRPSTAHYSQSLSYGPMLFMAGHIPVNTRAPGNPLATNFADLDPEDQVLKTGRSHTDSRQEAIIAQTVFTYTEIERHLGEIGYSLDDIVHVNVFLQNDYDYAVFHKVHSRFFELHETRPSLTIAGFREVGHKGTLIEIEPTALRKNTWKRRAVEWVGSAPVNAPAASICGDLVFFSGVIGLSHKGQMVMSVEDLPSESAQLVRLLAASERRPGFAAQCWMAWRRLLDAMDAASVSTSNLMKITVYLADPSDWCVHEVIRQRFVSGDLPAFECVCVPSPGGIPGAQIQIEAVGLR